MNHVSVHAALTATVLIAGCGGGRFEESPEANEEIMTTTTLLGLRTGIYHVADLDAAKAWYTELLGYGPYFDEPFYVGFDVGGYELGLNPDTASVRPGAGGTILYWGVADADVTFARLLELGATEVTGVEDVGGGIRHAIVRDPFGNQFGIIENPHFQGGR
jgi:predicted enzyme related to lactoylglutathione lyase